MGRPWVGIVSEDAWVRAFRADAATAQNGLCCYCREPLTAANISGDHVVPRIAGGSTDRKNIKAACRDCNRAKGGMGEKAFLAAIKTLMPGSPFHIMLAFMRRRIWVRTHRACERIERVAR